MRATLLFVAILGVASAIQIREEPAKKKGETCREYTDGIDICTDKSTPKGEYKFIPPWTKRPEGGVKAKGVVPVKPETPAAMKEVVEAAKAE